MVGGGGARQMFGGFFGDGSVDVEPSRRVEMTFQLILCLKETVQ
jgi:hypothetical protein